MTNQSGPLGRDSMAFRDKMKRYHAEIERLVYAAEIGCNCRKKNGDCLHLQGDHCPFAIKRCWCIGEYHTCAVWHMRGMIGEHVEQHDTEKV